MPLPPFPPAPKSGDSNLDHAWGVSGSGEEVRVVLLTVGRLLGGVGLGELRGQQRWPGCLRAKIVVGLLNKFVYSLLMSAATTSANLAAHTFSVSRSEGYGLPSYSVDITLGSVLGADHVAWVAEGPTPAATAHGLGLDAADANLLDMAAAYLELAHLLA